MNPSIMYNNFNEGDLLYARENPTLELCIRRYVHKIYYCKITSQPGAEELIYFDRAFAEKNPLSAINSRQSSKTPII
jgi:hypothetical protein